MCVQVIFVKLQVTNQCQGLGTNVDLVELETLEEQEAVYEYWYTQVEYNIHTFSNHLKNVPSYPYMSCLLDPYHNSEIQSIDI